MIIAENMGTGRRPQTFQSRIDGCVVDRRELKICNTRDI